MTNSMGHALLLLTICFMGAALLLTLMTYAESSLDRDGGDSFFRSLAHRLGHHERPDLVRAEAPQETVRHP
ncbi:MAG TPA: hypothetical protein VFR99_00610 [Marmoricola sp.]|nr:hypothetical protein [Marmoricola sp.]